MFLRYILPEFFVENYGLRKHYLYWGAGLRISPLEVKVLADFLFRKLFLPDGKTAYSCASRFV
jgi:hypothetical protein